MSGKFNFEIEQRRFDTVPVPTEADHKREKLERLRDWFATHATDADISAIQARHEHELGTKVTRERARYIHADAMLKAREVKP